VERVAFEAMVRRSFRVGLRVGLLVGVAFALVKTVQARRSTPSPPSRDSKSAAGLSGGRASRPQQDLSTKKPWAGCFSDDLQAACLAASKVRNRTTGLPPSGPQTTKKARRSPSGLCWASGLLPIGIAAISPVDAW
jgi:hypothetical protein